MMVTFAFAAIVLPDTVMLSACLVLTLAVLIFVFWIEPDPGIPRRTARNSINCSSAGIRSTTICAI